MASEKATSAALAIQRMVWAGGDKLDAVAAALAALVEGEGEKHCTCTPGSCWLAKSADKPVEPWVPRVGDHVRVTRKATPTDLIGRPPGENWRCLVEDWTGKEAVVTCVSTYEPRIALADGPWVPLCVLAPADEPNAASTDPALADRRRAATEALVAATREYVQFWHPEFVTALGRSLVDALTAYDAAYRVTSMGVEQAEAKAGGGK